MTKSNIIECPNCGCELQLDASKPESKKEKNHDLKPYVPNVKIQNGIDMEVNTEERRSFEMRKVELQEKINAIEKDILNSCQNDQLREMPWHKVIPPAMNRYRGQMYSGENLWLLWRKCIENNYSQNKWATFHQWSRLGVKVRKGEKSTLIKIFIPRDNPEQRVIEDKSFEHKEKDVNGFFVGYFSVFNAEQVTDWYEDTDQTTIWDSPSGSPYEPIDKLIKELEVSISEKGDRAKYKIGEDFISMPEKKSFTDTPKRTVDDAYYSLLLQELIHWTGHFSRCNRIGRNNLSGESGLVFEKMIAEMGGAMLSSYFHNHVEVRMENKRFIDSWKKIINHDIRYLYHAQNQALSAITWIFRKTTVFPFVLKEKPFYPMTEVKIAELQKIVG